MNPELNTNDESVLIENIKRQDRASFDTLVNLYRQMGLNIAYNLVGNFEDAKDVLQDAFIKVYLHINDFQERSKFLTWFYRIVVNCSLDFLRKRKRMGKIFTATLTDEDGKEEELQIPDDSLNPRRLALAHELGQKLEDCIIRLSEKQRICFVLKHQNGLRIQEIAKILKCSPGTVKAHLFRAIENLRQALSKYLE